MMIIVRMLLVGCVSGKGGGAGHFHILLKSRSTIIFVKYVSFYCSFATFGKLLSWCGSPAMQPIVPKGP